MLNEIVAEEVDESGLQHPALDQIQEEDHFEDEMSQ